MQSYATPLPPSPTLPLPLLRAGPSAVDVLPSRAICVSQAQRRFGRPEVIWILQPPAAEPQRLPRLVGLAKAKELIFTAAIIDAEEARGPGLVNHVVEPGQALERAISWLSLPSKVEMPSVVSRSLKSSSCHVGFGGNRPDTTLRRSRKWKRMTAF